MTRASRRRRPMGDRTPPLIPRFTDLRAPITRRAPTAVEIREYHAVRLALMVMAAWFQAKTYENTTEPIPGDVHVKNRWLRRCLRPLASGSPSVALLIRLVDLDGPRMAWDEPLTLRRHLHRLASEAKRLARTQRIVRHRPPRRRRP